MNQRLDITKTYKLYIDGKFPRSESGRSIGVVDGQGRVLAHICNGSRKDVRDAVTAARGALGKWKGATAYNRGQVLYRVAEMIEGKKAEFVGALNASGKSVGGGKRGSGEVEVEAAIDRLVGYAGWADKYAQVLGCNNPVAGPYYNFTVPEATGVIAVIAPDEPGLLGLVSLIAPVICSGNTCVALAGESAGARLAGVVLGEVMATSDVPGGVVNLLTGTREELVPVFASHRDIDGVHAAGVSAGHAAVLRGGVAENLKRVHIHTSGAAVKGGKVDGVGIHWFDADACQTPWWIEPFVEMKTIWHPAAS